MDLEIPNQKLGMIVSFYSRKGTQHRRHLARRPAQFLKDASTHRPHASGHDTHQKKKNTLGLLRNGE